MILAKLKYKRVDNKIVVTETLPLVKESHIKRIKWSDGTDYGVLIVFSKNSVTYTLFPNYPRPDMLYIGTQVGVLLCDNKDLSSNVCDDKFEDYLERYCPVYIRRSYNKRTKVHTIVFTDKPRNGYRKEI